MRHYPYSIGLALVIACASKLAFAAVDSKTLEDLRAQMDKGGELYTKNEFEAARNVRNAWLAALRVIPTPGTATSAARASVKLGKLTEAAKLYESALAMQPNEFWIGDAQQQVQAEAKEELEALKPRIPTLKVEGFTAADSVTLDGVTVEAASLAQPLLLDPGTHVVQATRNGKSVTQTVELAEGQHLTASLKFEPEGPGVPPGPPQIGSPQPGPGKSETKPVVAAPPPTPKPIHNYAMWSGFGVGAAGLVVGATAGIIALSKHESLMGAGCTRDQCFDTALQGKMDSYNSLLPISTAGFVIAGVGAAAGVTLWLTKPKQEAAGSASLMIGPSGIVAQGSY